MKAYVYLIFAALMWGVNFHLLKYMLVTVKPMEAGFWRYLFALIFIGIFSLRSLPSFKEVKAHALGILLVGLLGLFGFNVFLFWGVAYSSALNASLLMSLSPIATLYIARVVFKTPVTASQMWGACLSVLGVLYLISKGNWANLLHIKYALGDLALIVAVVLSSCYHVWVKKYAQGMDSGQFTFLSHILCFGAFAMVFTLNTKAESPHYDVGFWRAAVCFGVMGTGMTYQYWNKALVYVDATKAGFFMNLVPLSTAIVAVCTGEAITTVHLISGLLIFLGIMLALFKDRIVAMTEKD